MDCELVDLSARGLVSSWTGQLMDAATNSSSQLLCFSLKIITCMYVCIFAPFPCACGLWSWCRCLIELRSYVPLNKNWSFLRCFSQTVSWCSTEETKPKT